jgi:glutamate synthase domain-containing protein 3
MTENRTNSRLVIDTKGVYYRKVNDMLRKAVSEDIKYIVLNNVCGQRYLGTDLNAVIDIEINGTPGNDMGAFMNGPRLTVNGNAQDGCGNTMNEGEIVIHGHAGDIIGLAARGGKILVRDDVGYRAGIHMKEYQDKKPLLVIGGTAQDFLGEYMAGGTLVVLGLNLKEGEKHKAHFVGTGMHGGVIYLSGGIEEYQLGSEVGVDELDEADYTILKEAVNEYCANFSVEAIEILKRDFIKLYPRYLRPYGRLYAY